MTTILIATIATLHQEAHRQLALALRALCTRLIETRRQRRAERQMLIAVHQLDHPGVLADMQAACRQNSGHRLR